MLRGNRFAPGRTPLQKLWECRVGGGVAALAWSPPRGCLLAVAEAAGPIALVDGQTGGVRYPLSGHVDGTTATAWSPVGRLLASAGLDGKVRGWDPSTGLLTRQLDVHATTLAWSPRGEWLATAAGATLGLWDHDGNAVGAFHAAGVVDAVAWHPHEPLLASASAGPIQLWKPGQPGPVRSFDTLGCGSILAWSPTETLLAAGSHDGRVHLLTPETGDDLALSTHDSDVRALAWKPTGRYLGVAAGSRIDVWDCGSQRAPARQPLSLAVHAAAVLTLAHQSRGNMLASGGADGTVALTRLGHSYGALALAQLGEPVAHLAWSPDDRLLAAGTDRGLVVAFSVA